MALIGLVAKVFIEIYGMIVQLCHVHTGQLVVMGNYYFITGLRRAVAR